MEAKRERHVAEAIIRAHAEEVGPGSSTASVENVTSKTLQQIMEELGVTMEHSNILGIMEFLASQDYISLGPKESGDAERRITKIYPSRMKRQYNLWEIEF